MVSVSVNRSQLKLKGGEATIPIFWWMFDGRGRERSKGVEDALYRQTRWAATMAY